MSKYLQLADKQLIINNFNNDFLLVKSQNQEVLAGFGRAVFEGKFDFIEEVIVTEMEVCLKLNRHFEHEKLQLLKDLNITQTTPVKTYELPVCFHQHDDWKAIEEHTNLSKNEFIERLLKQEFSVAMFGFLPGFVYLNGLDTSLHIPRKTIPSKYVEANSLAIGGQYLGIYSLPSPGGWHVIGHLPIPILEIPNVPPVKFNLKDKIRLKKIDEEAFIRLNTLSTSRGRKK